LALPVEGAHGAEHWALRCHLFRASAILPGGWPPNTSSRDQDAATNALLANLGPIELPAATGEEPGEVDDGQRP